MDDEKIIIITSPITLSFLKDVAKERYGDLVKAVVDVEKNIMAIGGEMHADEEAVLLENGCEQQNLWGINLYPDKSKDEMVEFDSIINLRPRQENRSREIDNLERQIQILEVVKKLVA